MSNISKNIHPLITRYGSWALVTGASSGIGKELAVGLAKIGFNLIITGRDQNRLLKVKNEIAALHVRVIDVIADFSTPAGIDAVIQSTEQLDVGLLINNAGYGTSGAFVDSSIHEEVDVVHVNCAAVIRLTHYYAQLFRQHGKGGIVFLSSLVAFQGVPYAATYAASKAFIQSFAEALSIELAADNITIMSVAPGPVSSNFGNRANMKMGDAMAASAVVDPVIAGLGKRKLVIPGFLSKVLVHSLRVLPRRWRVHIMGRIMNGFTQHQR